jgi:ribonuclease HII
MVRRVRRMRSSSLFKFDLPFWDKHGLVAGVDEAGRGPLAGPVVSAAVILPQCRIPDLADSKQLNPERRWAAYRLIQRQAYAIGVGVVSHDEIDRVNILQATYASMRLALADLIFQPEHVLVDGYVIPRGPRSQTGIIDGDTQSACIAAASIVAKVTRDCIMEAMDREYPGYGFKQHKGYGTPEHMSVLDRLGPCTIHRRSFRPVVPLLPRDPSSMEARPSSDNALEGWWEDLEN